MEKQNNKSPKKMKKAGNQLGAICANDPNNPNQPQVQVVNPNQQPMQKNNKPSANN